MNATPSLTLAEAEALTYFLAERAELWANLAIQFGVKDPMRLPQKLAKAYKSAVTGTTISKPPKTP